ncbi:hypothetical protein OIU76_013661 [Salix suchowensis]|nr:hypothetical protein OIU76_013661 [Salix suchowensis]
MRDLIEDHSVLDSEETVAIFSEFFLTSLIAPPNRLDSLMIVIRNINPCTLPSEVEDTAQFDPALDNKHECPIKLLKTKSVGTTTKQKAKPLRHGDHRILRQMTAHQYSRTRFFKQCLEFNMDQFDPSRMAWMHASGTKSGISAAEDGKTMFQRLKMDGWRTNIAKSGMVEEELSMSSFFIEQSCCLRILLLEIHALLTGMENAS